MSHSLFSLHNKVAVVTGGAGLLGKKFCLSLANAGAKVILADINEAQAKASIQELGNTSIESSVLDISKEESVILGTEAIIKKHKKIDIWVNNAYPRTADWGLKFENIPWESWKQNINKHLNGYALCCQKVAEIMKLQKSGSIINMSSIYGIVGPDFSIYEGTQMTMPAAYAAIKGGLVNLTRYLASYYGPYGVRINAISPGGIYDGQPESFVKQYSKKTPLGRMGSADDLTGGLIYLASDAASYVTGQNLVIDGGWTSI